MLVPKDKLLDGSYTKGEGGGGGGCLGLGSTDFHPVSKFL